MALLLLLQRREQVTAAEGAVELEVSERTARRDLDAPAKPTRSHQVPIDPKARSREHRFREPHDRGLARHTRDALTSADAPPPGFEPGHTIQSDSSGFVSSSKPCGGRRTSSTMLTNAIHAGITYTIGVAMLTLTNSTTPMT